MCPGFDAWTCDQTEDLAYVPTGKDPNAMTFEEVEGSTMRALEP